MQAHQQIFRLDSGTPIVSLLWSEPLLNINGLSRTRREKVKIVTRIEGTRRIVEVSKGAHNNRSLLRVKTFRMELKSWRAFPFPRSHRSLPIECIAINSGSCACHSRHQCRCQFRNVFLNENNFTLTLICESKWLNTQRPDLPEQTSKSEWETKHYDNPMHCANCKRYFLWFSSKLKCEKRVFRVRTKTKDFLCKKIFFFYFFSTFSSIEIIYIVLHRFRSAMRDHF